MNRPKHPNTPPTQEEVRGLVMSKGGRLLSKYVGSDFKLTLKCSKGHVFHQRYRSVLYEGRWCVRCQRQTSQGSLYNLLQSIFPTLRIHSNYKGFKWLRTPKNGQQEIDLWVPALKLAIEYDGEQHFKPKERFGGKEGLRQTQARDRMKNRKLKEHKQEVRVFIRIKYNEPLTLEHVLKRLKSKGVRV
jgi:very-short-patch-repair endonuclease